MDVKVTPPIKVTTMPGAASAAGFALDHAHKGKLDGAEEACRRQGLAFLPLVAETFGGSHCVPFNTFGEQREIYEWIRLFFKPP